MSVVSSMPASCRLLPLLVMMMLQVLASTSPSVVASLTMLHMLLVEAYTYTERWSEMSSMGHCGASIDKDEALSRIVRVSGLK